MPKSNTIPSDEVKRLSAEAMDDTIRILQALADADRKEFTSSWKRGVFVIDVHRKLTGNIGTSSGSIFFPTPTSASATQYYNPTPVEKSFSVST
jgi:hypothetical protein